MAHLLGMQSCLESLARDVSDVQSTIMDITMKVGPVRVPSWKYPDKISCELDIEELLERYSYSKDQDHSRMSHIILFELLIDRFVLLQQCLSRFCDGVLQSCLGDARPKTGKAVGSSISVGLVAKKYWNKMVHIQQAVQQMHVETKTKTRNVRQMEETIKELREEMETYLQVFEKSSGRPSAISGKIKKQGGASKSSAKFTLSKSDSVSLRSSSPSPDLTLSVEDVAFATTCNDRATQTYDTAFVPCEACSRTQQNLLDVGNMVMTLCKSQGLPSSLAKQKRLLKQSLLAAADVSRWTAEQNRDLARINDHLDNLYAQINPLQDQLSRAQEKCKNLELKMKQMEGEKVANETEFAEQEEKLKMQISGVIAMKDKAVSELENTNTDLTQKRNMLQQVVSNQDRELQEQKGSLQEIEQEKSKLSEELDTKCQEVERLKEVEHELSNVKQDLESLQTELKKTALELGKVQAKNRSLEKHDKALQTKHESLLSRVDELDQECEELRERVLEAEEEKEEVLQSLVTYKTDYEELKEEVQTKQQLLDAITEEKNKLLSQIDELQEDLTKLQDEVKESEHNLRLVTDYPCLDGQGGAATAPTRDGRGVVQDGDDLNVTDEMGNQISSNNVRILLLEEQNETLRNSISKMAEQFGNYGTRTIDDPVTLWKQDTMNEFQDQRSRASSAKSQKRSSHQNRYNDSTNIPYKQDNNDFDKDHNLYNPTPPPEPKSDPVKPRRRTPSAKLLEKREASALSSKLAASSKMVSSMYTTSSRPMVDPPPPKQPSRMWQHDRPTESGWKDDGTVISTQRYSPVNMFVCQGCDKMYTTQKDLDIHKSFCYGNR